NLQHPASNIQYLITGICHVQPVSASLSYIVDLPVGSGTGGGCLAEHFAGDGPQFEPALYHRQLLLVQYVPRGDGKRGNPPGRTGCQPTARGAADPVHHPRGPLNRNRYLCQAYTGRVSHGGVTGVSVRPRKSPA